MTAAGVAVRTAAPADLAGVERIERASFSDPWSRDALWGELRTDAMRLPLVAESDGEICGFLMAWLVADQLHILNIATAPVRRRGGVATLLLQEAAGRALAQGLVEVTLEVRESNTPAIRFYGRHGFAVHGRRPRYYADNGEDALIMTRPLAGLAPRD